MTLIVYMCELSIRLTGKFASVPIVTIQFVLKLVYLKH